MRVRLDLKIKLAAPPGFEPEISAPKADVLPLHHGATLRRAIEECLTCRIFILAPLRDSVKGMIPPRAML